MKPPCQRKRYKKRRSSAPVVEIVKPARCPPVPSQDSSVFAVNYEEYGEYSYMYRDAPVEENPKAVLRKWLRGQKFLPQNLMDDFLEIFLWAADWNADEAKGLLLKYFYLRQEPSPLFRDRDPLSPENQNILSKLYALPVSELTKDGTKVILTGLVKPLVNYDQLEHLKLLAMTLDLLIWDKRIGYGDFSIVFDARGFQNPQLLENKVRNGKSMGRFFLDSIPGALKSFYLLHPPAHVSHVAESRNGIWVTVIKDVAQLLQLIPANILPNEYGGRCGPLKDLHDRWLRHLNDNRDFFAAFEKKMIYDYQRRMCQEKEMAEKGKNWVQNMKLEADEWEYKIQYYERMKTMEPLRHPAFGIQRLEGLSKTQRPEYQELSGMLKMRREADEDFLFPESISVEEPPRRSSPPAKKKPDADVKLLLELHLFI